MTAARRASIASGSRPPPCHSAATAVSSSQASPALEEGAVVVGPQHAPAPPLVVGDDVGGQLVGGRQQLVVRHDVVHQAPIERGGGVEEVAGGRQLAGPAHAHGLWQQDGEPPVRHDADPGVGIGERRPFGRDEEVAPQGQLEPAGDGDAVDRPDDRLADERERSALLWRPVVVAERLDRRAAPGAQLLEVEPGAEGGVGPGEDDDVDPVVAVEVTDRAVGALRSSRLSALRAPGRFSVTVATRSVTSRGRTSVSDMPANLPADGRRVGRRPAATSGAVVDRREERHGQVAQLHQRRGDPPAHGAQVVVEDRAVLERGLVELVAALVRHLDGVLALVEVGRTHRLDRRARPLEPLGPIGALASGSTASTSLGSGASASRCTRTTSSISMRGGSLNGSPMYHDRYAVCAQVGQSSVTSAWTRGGRPSPGRP